MGIVRIVVFQGGNFRLPLGEVTGVVQVADIGRDTVIAAQVLGMEHFFARQKGLVEFLAVARADHPDGIIRLQEGLERQGEGLERGGGGLLNKDIAGPGILIGIQDQVNRIVNGHHKTGHVRIGDGEGLAGLDLAQEEWDDRAARGHDVAVARTAEDGAGGTVHAGLGNHELFHKGLRHAHGIDGIDGLIGAEHDHVPYPAGQGGVHDVFGPESIGAQGLKREELAGGHLLESSGVENIIHALQGRQQAIGIAHIPDDELDLGVLERQAHVLLLLFVAAEDPDLFDSRIQEAPQNGVAERAGATRDEQYFGFKHGCFFTLSR